jgi:hypothetical protein
MASATSSLLPTGEYALRRGRLCAQCDKLVQDAALAPQRRDLSQRIHALEVQLETAASDGDFKLVASLGLASRALELESARLPLSERDYVALSAHHTELMRQMVHQCKELVQARQYAALAVLNDKLKMLRALDLAVPPEWSKAVDNDPLVVSADDAGDNDPVVVTR